MPYSTCAHCSSLIPNILSGASSFDGLGAEIVPGSAALILFMSSGCSLIEATLHSQGYTPAKGTILDDYLADIEANYCAYRAELVRGSPRTATGERTRADAFRRAYEDGLKNLKNMDLTRMGLEYSGRFYVGGISDAERDSVESDTDRTEPRFKRGKFDNPE